MGRPTKISIPEPPALLLWLAKLVASYALIFGLFYFGEHYYPPPPNTLSDTERRELACKHLADLYGDCIEISPGVWGFQNELKPRPD